MGGTRHRFRTLANLVNAGLERRRLVFGLSSVVSVLMRPTLLVLALTGVFTRVGVDAHDALGGGARWCAFLVASALTRPTPLTSVFLWRGGIRVTCPTIAPHQGVFREHRLFDFRAIDSGPRDLLERFRIGIL
ncbi:unnamed protein product [Linum trigynum]|uniref:Uncharacterized protein n=1 Tax=Linum trigynum TaxID=586398 RepID=A0AAV2D7S4_9ROSI